MKRTLLIIPLVIMIALLWQAGGGVGTALAACPAPTCASSVNQSDFTLGSWDCTVVGTRSDGTHAAVFLIYSDGVVNVTLNQATNNSSSAATTFGDFTTQTGKYCLNPDDTGYITNLSGGGCPLAIVVNSVFGEVRLLDTTQNRAEVGVCEYISP